MPAVRVLIVLLCLVALASAVLVTVQIRARVAEPVAVTSISYTQDQTVVGFTPVTKTITDPARIERFQALVARYDIDETDFDTRLNDVCTGGIDTRITLRSADKSEHRLRLYDCSGGGARQTFVTDATALLTRWAR
ncbi:hypothetical protein BH09ACT1_BH09ACT1_14950 [soil metagenome]